MSLGLGVGHVLYPSIASFAIVSQAVTVDCRGGCCLCPALSMASHQLDWHLGK